MTIESPQPYQHIEHRATEPLKQATEQVNANLHTFKVRDGRTYAEAMMSHFDGSDINYVRICADALSDSRHGIGLYIMVGTSPHDSQLLLRNKIDPHAVGPDITGNIWKGIITQGDVDDQPFARAIAIELAKNAVEEHLNEIRSYVVDSPEIVDDEHLRMTQYHIELEDRMPVISSLRQFAHDMEQGEKPYAASFLSRIARVNITQTPTNPLTFQGGLRIL